MGEVQPRALGDVVAPRSCSSENAPSRELRARIFGPPQTLQLVVVPV